MTAWLRAAGFGLSVAREASPDLAKTLSAGHRHVTFQFEKASGKLDGHMAWFWLPPAKGEFTWVPGMGFPKWRLLVR